LRGLEAHVQLLAKVASLVGGLMDIRTAAAMIMLIILTIAMFWFAIMWFIRLSAV